MSQHLGAAIHKCGGARMGADPAKSVVNNVNQTWDVPNLFVTDGASFVTNGTAGPALTIMALTSRACRFIIQNHGDGGLTKPAQLATPLTHNGDAKNATAQQNGERLMIPDRIIEQGTLRTDGTRTSVEVRLPWYRALPGSCISEASLTVDGVEAPAESLLWTMNNRTFRMPELVDEVAEWWFPVDSVVLSGALALLEPGAEHRVEVGLKLYIPYIVTAHGVLRIEERDVKTMSATVLQEVTR